MAKVKAKQQAAAPHRSVVSTTAGGIRVPRNIQREDDMLGMWLALIAAPAGTLCGVSSEGGVRFYAIELSGEGSAALRDVTCEVEPVIQARMQADRQARARDDRDLRRLRAVAAEDEGARTRAADGTKPTAETERRHAPPPLENLFARGKIAKELHDAGCEIERVFHWVTSGLASRSMELGAARGKAFDDGSGPLAHAYATRYSPWRDALSSVRQEAATVAEVARVFRNKGRAEVDDMMRCVPARGQVRRSKMHPKTLQIVIEVVVDGRTIETIARDEGMNHQKVRAILDAGLELYVEIAGWARRAA